MPNKEKTISVTETIKKHLNNPNSQPLPIDVETMRKNLATPKKIKEIHEEFRNPSKKGGKKKKRKTTKKNKNKRKYTIRRRRR